MPNRGFSQASLSLSDSITHGTRARIEQINQGLAADARVIDLSIGTLDLPADPRIDAGVRAWICDRPEVIHAFAPVKGFPFLRQSLAAKIRRMHCIDLDPETEVMVTPGGIKGALTVMFHTLIDPGDEVLIPVPNWPHYADMMRLHLAVPNYIPSPDPARLGLTSIDLERSISDRTKLLILGDCINPTGKVYSTEELRGLARVVATHNVRRKSQGRSPIHVIFDCPYEAHILGPRPTTFALIEVDVPGLGRSSMRSWTATLSGPGKTYGMHGDRIGHLWAAPETVEIAARVQVNTNSFASTYGQVATHLAFQEEMDEVAANRVRQSRKNLEVVLHRLARHGSLKISPPDGGYFLFVDFSNYSRSYAALGYQRADLFLLHEARVAGISGIYFAEGCEGMDCFVRLNCGRDLELLEEACSRIENVLSRLRAEFPHRSVPAQATISQS
jgi:aspartate/methionine/tyrosine aminotransferase